MYGPRDVDIESLVLALMGDIPDLSRIAAPETASRCTIVRGSLSGSSELISFTGVRFPGWLPSKDWCIFRGRRLKNWR